jgi:hypothetical protein
MVVECTGLMRVRIYRRLILGIRAYRDNRVAISKVMRYILGIGGCV